MLNCKPSTYCDHCKREFYSPKFDLEKHRGGVRCKRFCNLNPTPTFCPLCNKNFYSWNFDLGVHQARRCVRPTCKKCNLVLPSFNKLLIHEAICAVSDPEPEHKPVEEQSGANTRLAEGTVKQSNLRKPKIFSRSILRKHKCRVCLRRFVHTSTYLSHVSSHTEKSFCSICNKGFSFNSLLVTHLRGHS